MSRLHLHILGSGSKGNCAFIEGPQGLIMVDDGLSRRETLKRMAELGLSADDVSALVVTHEHSDHIKGLEVWCKYWNGPVFSSRGTLTSKESLAHLPVEEFDQVTPSLLPEFTFRHIRHPTTSLIPSATGLTLRVIRLALPPTPASCRSMPSIRSRTVAFSHSKATTM